MNYLNMPIDETGRKKLHSQYVYPKLTLIICKKARQPPEDLGRVPDA